MRTQLTQAQLLEMLSSVNPDFIIPTLEEGIKNQRILLDANMVLGNHAKCQELLNNICDSKIMLSFLYLRSLGA